LKEDLAEAFHQKAQEAEFAHNLKVLGIDNIASYPSGSSLKATHRAGVPGEDLVTLITKLTRTVLADGDHSPSRNPRVSQARESTESPKSRTKFGKPGVGPCATSRNNYRQYPRIQNLSDA